MFIADRLSYLNERIEKAAQKSGRYASDIKLITVTKTVAPALINEAIAAGAKRIGENRVQELLEKKDALLPVEKHLIGSLQTNKARQIVGQVEYIHSLDRPSLAEALQKASASKQVKTKVLIQVKIGDESSKSGVLPEKLPAFLDTMEAYPALEPCGLMCIPPPAKADQARRYFAQLRELKDLCQKKGFADRLFQELSMGMSGDFEEAIMEGATMIRVGSAIFGERLYKR